jgi:hypothetical protein
MEFPFGERLRAGLGPARHPRQLASSPRSNVWRADVGGAAVVVKQIVGGADAAERYAREVAALELAARVRPPVVPALLGADPGTLTLVLEHLGDAGPAEDWVVAYASGLARLHAAAGPADAGVLPRWRGPDADDVRAFVGLAGRLGVSVEAEVGDELAALVERLGRLPKDALLHGDPCPGNDLYVSGEVRFVDFEQAALGNGLMELAYLRIGFPTCWCVTEVAEPLLDRAESAYRTAWRAATGAEAGGDLVDACAGWLIRGDALVQRAERETADQFARVSAEDWSWGTVTARERLAHRLGVVARLADGHGDLAGLSRLAAAMRGRLLDRWSGLRPPPLRRP